MRQVLRALVVVLVSAGALGTCVLVRAHRQIRSIDPAIPPAATIFALEPDPAGPISLHFINTASQGISHPAYLLGWPDGRLFMIDAGMNREDAAQFGRGLEFVMGTPPIVIHGSVDEHLGDAIERIGAVAFTHLHNDHTSGLVPVCNAIGHEITRFQTSVQVEQHNHTTAIGAAFLEEAGCAKPYVLEGPGPHDVPGYPGLVALAVGGHTPGSTVYIARLPDRTFVFAGDIHNVKAELLANRPKPWAYSTFFVPEDPERLERLRLWLAELDRDPETTVVVAHDVAAAEADGVAPYPGPADP